MNFHLVRDNPVYIDLFIEKADKISKVENVFICIGHSNKKLNRIKSDNIKIFTLKKALAIFNEQNFNKLFIHYLDNNAIKFISKIDKTTPIYWFLWGSDAYKHPELHKNIYLPKTREILKKLPYGKFNIKNPVLQSLKNFLFRIKFSNAIKRIDYCCIQVEEDYQMIKDLYPSIKLKHKYFAYKGANLLKESSINRIDLKNSKHLNLIVGNSANPSNNHLDVLNILSAYKESIASIICPLSYSGPKEYIKEVQNFGKSNFGDKFKGLTEFLPLEEYQDLMETIDVGVFYHSRQQAYSNTLLMLHQNKKILMNPSSNLFKMYKDFEIENVFSDYDTLINSPIRDNEKLYQELGQSVIDEWYNDILNN